MREGKKEDIPERGGGAGGECGGVCGTLWNASKSSSSSSLSIPPENQKPREIITLREADKLHICMLLCTYWSAICMYVCMYVCIQKLAHQKLQKIKSNKEQGSN